MDQPEKVCYTLESMLPNSVSVTLAAACICFICAFGATLLAAAMIYFSLKHHQNEIRFCVVISLTLASIISGIMYLDKHLSLKKEPQSHINDHTSDIVPTTLASKPLIFVSPGLCETLQFLQEFAFSSVIIWLAAECVRLIIVASVTPTVHIQRHVWFKLGVYLVPGIMYPFTFVGLWLIFKLVHRQHWLGCFDRNDYDLTTSVPNAFMSAMTCLFAICLVIVFCLPKYVSRGRAGFFACLVSWLSAQPLQVLTLLQAMNYASRNFVLYYGEAHDMAYQILHIVYGPWIVILYSALLVYELRKSRQQSRSMVHLIM